MEPPSLNAFSAGNIVDEKKKDETQIVTVLGYNLIVSRFIL